LNKTKWTGEERDYVGYGIKVVSWLLMDSSYYSKQRRRSD